MKETYKSFFDRIEPFMAPSDLMNVKIAYLLSKSAHRYQKRTKEKDSEGNPVRYFEHPRRVAIYLIDSLGIRDPEMIIAALLHDCLEDTRVTEQMLEHLFGKSVTMLIKLVSKLNPKDSYFMRLKKYGDWRAWTIKCADRLDNLSNIEGQEFIKKQLDETRNKIVPILELIARENIQAFNVLSNDICNILNRFERLSQ